MVEEAIDWDSWRAAYAGMTFADQVAFYEMCLELHPGQQSYDSAEAIGVLRKIRGWYERPLRVVELGGWDGRLGRDMLSTGLVGEWTNYDLVEPPQAVAEGYAFVRLVDWFWSGVVVDADLFVASHTIEHLSLPHLQLLAGCLTTDWVHLQAPLEREPRAWAGYPGSHILEVGWDGVDDVLANVGYLPWGNGLWRQMDCDRLSPS